MVSNNNNMWVFPSFYQVGITTMRAKTDRSFNDRSITIKTIILHKLGQIIVKKYPRVNNMNISTPVHGGIEIISHIPKLSRYRFQWDQDVPINVDLEEIKTRCIRVRGLIGHGQDQLTVTLFICEKVQDPEGPLISVFIAWDFSHCNNDWRTILIMIW